MSALEADRKKDVSQVLVQSMNEHARANSERYWAIDHIGQFYKTGREINDAG